jgi:type I restriction enzyme S subunit
MSFLQYQNYKYSGYDWLGKIPAEWSLGKFRHLFSESSEKIESGVYGEMLSVSGYRGIEVKEYADDNQKRTEENLIGYRIVHQGQLVVNTMWLNYAGLGISQLEGHVSPAYRSYWVNDGLHKPFVHHLMRSSLYVLGYTKYLTGVRPNSLQMGRDDLMSFPIVIPSLKEQKVIASFLDHEVTKIDKLVAEQGKLIELLKEKRQAVISKAVTKGLDAKATMKDSGIKWLGEVPEHWSIERIRRFVKLNPSKSELGILDKTTEVSFLPMEAIGEEGTLSLEKTKPLSEVETGYTYFREGDVTVAKITPCFENGKGAVMKGLHNGFGFGTTELIVARPTEGKVIADFLYRLFSSSHFRKNAEGSMYGAGGQKRVSDDFIREFQTGLPPVNEQIEIAEFIDHETVKFESLIKEATSVITLLNERRSALITAAVTGQIDVRNYQPKEVA